MQEKKKRIKYSCMRPHRKISNSLDKQWQEKGRIFLREFQITILEEEL